MNKQIFLHPKSGCKEGEACLIPILSILDEAVWPPLLAMLAANLFRPLPAPAHPCLPPDLLAEAGDGCAMALAPDWPHLHVAYDILSAAVAEVDERTLRRHIDRGFLRGLLALFQSEDPRESDRLKVVYHQLYSKLAPDRGFMRRQMEVEDEEEEEEEDGSGRRDEARRNGIFLTFYIFNFHFLSFKLSFPPKQDYFSSPPFPSLPLPSPPFPFH